MSRAIHEAISSWLFQDLSIVKKICGDFEVLGITRLFDDLFARVLIPGDGKQIGVQFCCETFYKPSNTLTISTCALESSMILSF